MLADIWNNILFYPILNILVALYHLFGNNLGWAVIVLAIFTRLILIPSTKKQMDMTKKMAALKPAMEDLNKKYANNKELLAKEQIKLYKEYGYNPLGCFFNFIPKLVILLVIVQVIRVVTGNNYSGLYPFVQTWVSNGGTFTIDTHFFFWDLAKNFSAISKDTGFCG
jgi:YidC/Oxa1 family membrane protein insertase